VHQEKGCTVRLKNSSPNGHKNFGNTVFRENPVNKANGPVERIKIGLVVGLLATLTGCAGYWGRGYYYGNAVVMTGLEPDLFLFGGDYGRGRDAHNYSHRGSESRRAAHPGGGRGSESRGAPHPGGGQRGKR